MDFGKRERVALPRRGTGAAEFVERVRQQRAEGYRLVGAFDDGGSVVAVADSATHRHDAHRRYLSARYIIEAFHFAKPVRAPRSQMAQESS